MALEVPHSNPFLGYKRGCFRKGHSASDIFQVRVYTAVVSLRLPNCRKLVEGQQQQAV